LFLAARFQPGTRAGRTPTTALRQARGRNPGYDAAVGSSYLAVERGTGQLLVVAWGPFTAPDERLQIVGGISGLIAAQQPR
jgi:hypothetical protein